MPGPIYSDEPYTAEERAYLAAHYAAKTRDELARDLGRTPGSITQYACRILRLRKRPRLDGPARELLRRLHAGGLSDAEAAARMGVARGTAALWRRGLGLTCNVSRRSCGEMGRDALRRKAAAMGVDSWAEHLADRRRLACARQWPGCWTPTQVAVCRALAAAGGTLCRGALAGAAGAHAGSVSRALRQLDGAGVVRREGGLWALVPMDGRRGGRHKTGRE